MKKFILTWLLLTSCELKKISTIKLPENSCRPHEIALNFEPVHDLSSSLRNQELASLYFFEQKQQKNSMITCYESVIGELNK